MLRLAAPGHVIQQDNRTGRVSYWQQSYHQSAADSRGVSTDDARVSVYHAHFRETPVR